MSTHKRAPERLGLSWFAERPSSVSGLSWFKEQTAPALVILSALALMLTVLAPAARAEAPGPDVSVIVREVAGSGNGPEHLVADLGGSVNGHLAVIDSFVATVPSSKVDELRAHPGVYSVVTDGSVQLLAKPAHGNGSSFGDGEGSAAASMDHVRSTTAADYYWNAGFLGQGIDIAMIDSGVVPVLGLVEPGTVVNGIDLSFESQVAELMHLDTFGHGTHLAGIMVGSDAPITAALPTATGFAGMAPQAGLVNVKVAAHDGSVDVSQVIAAIDWVVQHRSDNGMNIRVLNLSFGTDGTQAHQLDPLAHAVEVAWEHGIVVVVATGNDGNASLLRNPALNPFVIAVGASDTMATDATRDDIVTDFTNCGTDSRHVDLVAPGQSIVSLRNPGSKADLEFPSARVEDRFFKGTGTSQAAAVVSGAAALVLSQHPQATPDQVKALLMGTAKSLKRQSTLCQGSGTIALNAALETSLPSTVQTHETSTGTGTLDGARGTFYLMDGDTALTGELDIFGNAFDSAAWAAAATQGASWSGGTWNGASWSGASWSGASWSGASWSGASWSGASWSGASWSGASWSGASWSGASWSGASWSGASWSGASWSGASWSGSSWSGLSWF